MRKGLGKGLGMGYKNLAPMDSHVHRLSAKGVKSVQNLYAGGDYYFGMIPTREKEGLIREIARKVHQGVDWAVEWEKKHLPSQKNWVKKEYAKAKEQLRKGLDALKQDKDDVRDELDSNDDGIQDIELSELHQVNAGIREDLESIDLDDSGVPDYVEENVIEVEEQEITFPVPTLNPKETFGRKVKKTVGKVGEVAHAGVEAGRRVIEKRQLKKDFIRSLSEKELESKAIEVGKPTFGKLNDFEKEILRRREERVRISNLKKGIVPESSGAGIDLGFLNPLSGLSTKKEDTKKDEKKSSLDLGFLNPLGTLSSKK